MLDLLVHVAERQRKKRAAIANGTTQSPAKQDEPPAERLEATRAEIRAMDERLDMLIRAED